MNSIYLPIILTMAGLIGAVMAYQGIRRGGARFYTLEREAILRRAGFTLIGSIAVLILAVVLLFLQIQGLTAEPEEEEVLQNGTVVATQPAPISTPTIGLQFPPASTPTPTVDLNIPTSTPTPIICRAVVTGTSFGLYLRDVPGGSAELALMEEGTVITLLEDEPVSANGFTWRRVRATGGLEGWVAQEFIEVRPPCE